jgi:hypothetical protein
LEGEEAIIHKEGDKLIIETRAVPQIGKKWA